MATFHKGDMWTRFGEVDLFCFTANSTLKNNGALVMGAGIAKQVRDKFPGIDRLIGQDIRNYHTSLYPTYGVFIPERNTKTDIGAFQVKHHFSEKADVHLIARSCYDLMTHIMLTDLQLKVALNFPGIGNGGLAREDVLPIIAQLPDNVEIWEYE